nr:reverse transcriptase domain-containing protein [Tanacetum cinerariifolium]
MTNERGMTPPPGFSTPPQIPNINTCERPHVTTTVFAATTPENTPFAYRASTSANPNHTISPTFVKANYEVLESLLRERRRQIRNKDLRTELEYFSEDYDEVREMEPRPGPTRETTPPLRPRSLGVRRQRERGVGFEEAPNREGSEAGRNAEDLTGFVTPFVRWIKDYPLPDGLKMPFHIGYYNGKRDPNNFLHLFEGVIRMQNWLMLVACHMFTYTLKDSARIWWNSQKAEKVARSFEQTPRMFGSRRSRDMSKYCHFYEEHGHNINDCRQLRSQIEEAVKLGQLSHLMKGIKKEKWESYTRDNTSEDFISEGRKIKFPSVTRGSHSSALVIITAKIFRREVGQVHMHSGSSCKVIYEHYFMKLKPSIRASKIDSKVPLIRFSGEKSWSIEEIPLEIMIGDPPLARRETLNFVIVKSDSPYNMLLGRKTMQKMGHAYKGYHQIQMAEADEDKTSFFAGEGVFYYQNMPFGLKNVGAKYQRLVDKVFHDQIGRNLEACVDDMVIKSTSEEDMLADIKETFEREMGYIQGILEVMQILAFMSNSKCPELARRFADQVPAARNSSTNEKIINMMRVQGENRKQVEVEGYLVRRVFVDQGIAIQMMFEHCFDNLPSSVKAQLTQTQTDLVGFSRKQLMSMGNIKLSVMFESERLCRRTMMKFTVVHASSPYNIILGHTGMKELRAISSTTHAMMKFPDW